MRAWLPGCAHALLCEESSARIVSLIAFRITLSTALSSAFFRAGFCGPARGEYRECFVVRAALFFRDLVIGRRTKIYC